MRPSSLGRALLAPTLCVTAAAWAGGCAGDDDGSDAADGLAADASGDAPADAGEDAPGDAGDATSEIGDAADTETGDDAARDDATDDSDTATDDAALALTLTCTTRVPSGDAAQCLAQIADGDDGVTFAWSAAAGAELTADGAEASLRWTRVGRHVVQVQASRDGSRALAQATVTVHWPVTSSPVASSSVVVDAEEDAVVIVSPDSDEVSVFDGADAGALSLRWRRATCSSPRTVATSAAGIVVACQHDDALEVFGWDGESRGVVALPHGARPFGVIAHGDAWWASGQGRGELYGIDGATMGVAARLPVGTDVRALAAWHDGRVLATRWRSAGGANEAWLVDTSSGDVETLRLAFDPRGTSDTEHGGVLGYVQAVAVSPNGRGAALPGTHANIGVGRFRDGTALTFESTVRAAVAFVRADGSEDPSSRKLFDDRGLASAAVYSPTGDYLYLLDRGARSLERLDVLTGAQSGTYLDVGLAPQGLATSANGAWLYVDAYMSRELAVYEADGFGRRFGAVGRYPVVSSEPLDATLLRGKQLFNDAFDTRLSRSSYIACAHCHLDGESDNLVWDFTSRGEGLRNTTSLLGRAGVGHGPVHWSANFDEIQDFEHDIRNAFQGTGLMDDSDFHSADRDRTLGGRKAGVSADLDALAAYVTSLASFPRSPLRTDDGALSAAALRGQAIFEDPSRACTTCHAGEALTDSGFDGSGEPLLHDVGTLLFTSGSRLGGVLPGIDTPTLRGMWNDPPYFHDGSAATILDAVARDTGGAHGDLSGLSEGDLADLAAYLGSLE